MDDLLPTLFNLTKDIYRWYSEVTYNSTEEKVIADIKDYNENHLIKEEEFISSSENFNLYKETGVALWRTFRLEEAEPFLEKIKQKDPANTDILFYLGEIALEKKEYQKAITYFNNYLQIHPTHIPKKQEEKHILKIEDNSTSIPDNNYLIDLWYIDLHRYDPNTIEAYTYLAEIYLVLNNIQESINYYQKAIDSNPNHHLAPYIRLAEVLHKQSNNLSTIISLYKKAADNLSKTKWIFGTNESYKCNYYPKLSLWLSKKYKYTYCYPNYLLAYTFNQLSDLCVNKKLILECIENAIQLWDLFGREVFYPGLHNPWDSITESDQRYRFNLSLQYDDHRKLIQKEFPLERVDLIIKKAKLLLELYKDYWQVEILCTKALRGDNKNHPELKRLIEEAIKRKGY